MSGTAVRIGSGGWWTFPGGLARYARHFDFVELNASYYRLPTREQALRWRAEVPESFEFAVKMPRDRPKDPADLWAVLDTLAARYVVVHSSCPWGGVALDLLHDHGYRPVLERRGRRPAEGPPPPRWVRIAEDPSLPETRPRGEGEELYARVFGAERGVAHHLGKGMIDRVATTATRRASPAKGEVRIVTHSYQMYVDAERIRQAMEEAGSDG